MADRSAPAPRRFPALHWDRAFAPFALAFPGLSVLLSQAVVPLLAALAVLAGLLFWLSERRLPRPDPALAVCCALLGLWALITTAWSYDPADAVFRALRLSLLFACGLLAAALAAELPAARRRQALRWLAVGLAIAVLLMIFDGLTRRSLFGLVHGIDDPGDLDLHRLNRGATAIAIALWPIAAMVWQGTRRALALALLLLGLLFLAFYSSNAAIAGLGLGLLVFALGQARPGLARPLLIAIFAVGLLLAPLLARGVALVPWQDLDFVDFSTRDRVVVWSFVSDRIVERPLFGWGFKSARHIEGPTVRDGSAVPLHPHNAPLQLWLELGLPGPLLALALGLVAIGRIERLEPLPRACAQGMLVTVFVIACTAYGIWQNQWLAAVFAGAILMALTGSSRVDKPAAQLAGTDPRAE